MDPRMPDRGVWDNFIWLLLQHFKNGDSTEAIKKLKELLDQYYLRDGKYYLDNLAYSNLEDMVDTAAEEGLFSFIKYVHDEIAEELVIRGALAKKLFNCPHGDKLEILDLGALFNVKRSESDLDPTEADNQRCISIARLALAAIESKKGKKIPWCIVDEFRLHNYSPNPQELNKLIDLVKSSNGPFQIYFITAGQHWIPYVLHKDENGKIKLFIFDSLGMPSPDETCKKILQGFQEDEVCVTPIQIQYKFSHCEAFALSNLVQLAFSIGNIFDELKEIVDKSMKKGIGVELDFFGKMKNLHVVLPPISLLRMTDDTLPNKKIWFVQGINKVSQDYYSNEERNVIPINKKGETYQESIKKDTIYIDFLDRKHLNKNENIRLMRKSENMKILTLNYLMSVTHFDDSFLASIDEEFGVNGLMNKINQIKEENYKKNV